MSLLVLNAGSATLKFALFHEETCLARGILDRLGEGGPARFGARDAAGRVLLDTEVKAETHEQALPALLDWLKRQFPAEAIEAVGHRVVHGGDRFTTPVRLDDDALAYLQSLVPLAPLHQPNALGPIRHLHQTQPALPQIACFDTAFHVTQARSERLYALPRRYWDKGVKKYGFHGLSYEYIASKLPEVDARAAAGRTVVFHLGNGASMCGLKAGKSVASTMGFTALEGLVMGTRAGRIDPGVLLYLLDQEKMSGAELADLLYKKSGLLGVSGESSDMRDLLASSSDAAAEAVELFCRRAAAELGALAMKLEGVDALVFTAGIGEHAAPIREHICARARWLGVKLDGGANARNEARLHAEGSAVAVHIVPTNEELMIARHVRALLV
jgi:acetate kinase